MIQEDYVSFETAKILKEKGFDYYPDGSYWLIDANNVMYWVSEIGAYDYVDNPTDSFQRPKNGYRLVTLQMAMKWLREVHNLHIWIGHAAGKGLSWYYEIHGISDGKVKHIGGIQCGSYEVAVEVAIKYCLEKLI